ncbi:hypothetical protein PTSG_01806 [Salpingoeca rosetta]|uniref:TNFR-Cys domain-containing protein n=1 Tax=Salpingoeca rosetta (strain ATCC 50818 / BSB-021) TaxID=946362 RepID=F2TZ06_SALR5|nr:uncharacterized protein PTSG_01806 [Salpingoeca rosetta]EGD78830.1 hypothetical protein PTSG_01806 [Salpingoeca rosetta]|eukprot:XP_004997786.1 hypothetical protein PTSG_01806 [Salpingoeca rosetta]
MASNYTTRALLVLVTIASFAFAAQAFCDCQVTCENGYSYTTTLNSTCANCDFDCSPYFNQLEQRYCPNQCRFGGCSETSYCTDVSHLAAGIIAAIVIGILVVVVFAPLAFCFCMGVACFAGRRRPNYTVVHTYGTA